MDFLNSCALIQANTLDSSYSEILILTSFMNTFNLVSIFTFVYVKSDLPFDA